MKKLVPIFIVFLNLVAFISCESKGQKIEELAEAASKALDRNDYETALKNYTEIKSIDTLYPKMDCMIGATQYLLGNKNEAFQLIRTCCC